MAADCACLAPFQWLRGLSRDRAANATDSSTAAGEEAVHQALLVNGGGVDGGAGAYLANADDVHVVGSLAPILDGWIACIVIARDGSRYVGRAVPDPLAQ